MVHDTFTSLQGDLADQALRVRPYEPGVRLSAHEVEHLHVAHHPLVGSQLALLAHLAELEPFDESGDCAAALRYYVIVLQPESAEPICCFRAYSARNLLHRTWFAAVKHGPGYYDAIRDPGLLFDRHIDAFCQGNDVFILNKDKFQRIFQFYDAIQHDATAAIQRIQQRVPFANAADFQNACRKDVRMAALVGALRDAPHLDVLSLARIRRAIQQFDLRVEIVGAPGDERLVYAPATRWEFINLLCDNYLGSHVTGLRYEVNSKRPLHRSAERQGRN